MGSKDIECLLDTGFGVRLDDFDILGTFGGSAIRTARRACLIDELVVRFQGPFRENNDATTD